MRVKILKEHQGRKIGDILDIEFNGGEQEYIENGFIEVLENKKETLILNDNGVATEIELTPKEVSAKKLASNSFLNEIVTDDYSYKSWLNHTTKWIDSRRCLAFEFWKEYFYGKKKSLSPNQILQEQSNEEELEKYETGKINWIDNDFYDNWKSIKLHTKILLNNKEEYSGEIPKWFFLANDKDEISGRPQLIENVQKRIPLIRCGIKKTKDKKTKIESTSQTFYFFDEKFDKRYDGIQADAFALDFRMYRVISEDAKEYYLMSQKELPNQVCTFKGMLVELDDFAEISRSMKLSSLSRIFFVKDYEPSIKTLDPASIVKYTKNREITEKDWLDFLAFHELGTSNRFPYEAEMLRSSHLLSSKVDKIPQHIGVMGPAGSRKSCGYIETIAHKFSESPNIIEGANSRIKGLTPSFAVKPANLGYLAKCERIGWIDELGKMVEAEANKHQANTKNILGELNALLDNKIREVSSGNDNTCSVQATAKFIFVMNPISGIRTLSGHVGLIDPTTMSRILWWVQDKDEIEFVLGNDGVKRFPPTSSQDQNNGLIRLDTCRKTKNDIVLGKGWGKIEDREEFLTLFDSCNDFLCGIDIEKVTTLSDMITQLAREPMKSVWRPRAEHHVKLLIDGLVKHRCLFRDYDEEFIPIKEDYDVAEKIMVRMVKGWDTVMEHKNPNNPQNT